MPTKNRVTAGPQLRRLMIEATNQLLRNEVAGRAEGVVKERLVVLICSPVTRNTMDGHQLVPMIRSWVDGERVSRARLFTLVGEPC